MTQEDKAFYMSIWNSREHRCESCGCHLGREPRSFMFDHLLEKKPYPQFRHIEKNIFVVCLVCHTRKGRGFPTEKHKQAVEKAKEELL